MRKIVDRSLRQARIGMFQEFEPGNGAEAQENKVDLILRDINTQVMDGPEFIKQFGTVEKAQGVPVVMIATEGSEAHVGQALACGTRGYIRRQFTADQVKDHIIPILAGKS